MNRSTLVTWAGLIAGSAVSALVIPGHWLLVASLGFILGFGNLYLAIARAGAARPHRPHVKSGWTVRTVYAFAALVAVGAALILALLLQDGNLYRLRPPEASLAVFISLVLLGLATAAALNARRMVPL